MGACAVILSLITLGLGIQKLIWGDTQTEWRSHMPIILIFQSKEVRQKVMGIVWFALKLLLADLLKDEDFVLR
jgi:hypothetical protein